MKWNLPFGFFPIHNIISLWNLRVWKIPLVERNDSKMKLNHEYVTASTWYTDSLPQSDTVWLPLRASPYPSLATCGICMLSRLKYPYVSRRGLYLRRALVCDQLLPWRRLSSWKKCALLEGRHLIHNLVRLCCQAGTDTRDCARGALPYHQKTCQNVYNLLSTHNNALMTFTKQSWYTYDIWTRIRKDLNNNLSGCVLSRRWWWLLLLL